MIKNLWIETNCDLEDHGKTFDDVLWIGCPDFKISKDDFKRLADVEYDSGYGAPEVAEDLLIVGDGWWMERGDYDGAEWWNWKEPPKEPEETRVVSTLVCGDLAIGWKTLRDLDDLANRGVEEDPLPY
jgi:hypothetical protein